MTNITQFSNIVDDLSAQLFKFSSEIKPFTLLDEIPDDVSSILNSSDLEILFNNAYRSVKELNDGIKPHLSKLHRVIHPKKKIDPTIPYADFKVDEPPIYKSISYQQLCFEDLLFEQDIKPINHRKDFNYTGNCPYCSAPSEYLYSNNNGRQYLCKVCRNTFTDKVTPADQSGFYCPHCSHKLTPCHDRKGYIVYSCPNNKCSYYKAMKQKKEENPFDPDIITSSKRDRFRYHYREFKFNINEIKETCKTIDTKVNLAKIHVDPRTLGLILTYSINYGLSARKVSNLMRDIHGVKVSHQTIHNYIHSVSSLVHNMVDNYDYSLTSTQSGDETYIHVNGKNQYIFFFSDPVKKTITSYQIYKERDTKNAVESIYRVIKKFNGNVPKDLSFIVDGNPIYNAAQVFFHLNGIDFELHQVIGVKNKDEVSKEFRPIKQHEERLNRTFKENYYPMNGFHSLEKANSYMVTYVAFFNFLRRHSALGYNPPERIEELESLDFMHDKWLKLIEIASKYNFQS